MNKKKIIKIAIAVVVLILLVVGIIFLLSKRSNEEALTKNLESLGKTFYEEYYYPSQEKYQDDVKKFVGKFSDVGIKVNLENISKTSKADKELIDGMVNSKTKKKCDFEKSTVTIYPKKPFGKKDYKIEVNLDCGFESKDK